MPTVSAGSSSSFTLPSTQEITITPAVNGAAEYEVRRNGAVIASDRLTRIHAIGTFEAGDVFRVTAQRGAVDYTAGPAGRFPYDGYIGYITPSNFGVNANRYPLQWDGITTAAATHTGVAGSLAQATQPGNWVRIFIGFDGNGKGGAGTGPATGLFTAGTTTFSTNRLADLQYAIGALHDAGLKVLIALEGYVPTDATAMGLYRDRLDVLLRVLRPDPSAGDYPEAFARQRMIIDAFEPSNEVYDQQQNHGVSLARIAEMMRVTWTLFRALSPETIVLSASYQGGEAMGGNLVLQLMETDASGVSVLGSTGTGTTAEQFCDAIAFHPYIEVLSTVASALAALTSNAAQLRMREFLDPITAAFTTRRAANPTYWAGRADPQVWATEYNVNPNGGVATTNSAFRMQAFTPEQRGVLIEQMISAAFACGVAVVMPYAVDHLFTQGPIGQMTCSAVNGELRMDTSTAGSTAVLDGDLIFVSDGGGWSNAYNATENGVLSTARGIPSNGSANQYYQVTAYRWQLGGWADSYRDVQARFFGYAEAGWSAAGTTAVPELRLSTTASAAV